MYGFIPFIPFSYFCTLVLNNLQNVSTLAGAQLPLSTLPLPELFFLLELGSGAFRIFMVEKQKQLWES